MRIGDAVANEGVESTRRRARYPATVGATHSSRSPESERPRDSRRGAGRGSARRGAVEDPVLEPPIRIASVAEDPRVKGRVRIRCQALAGIVTLVIGASGVRAFNVRTGMVLDGVGWAALLREARVVRAQDAALRMLSTSRRSRRDLELRLRRREADPSVITDAMGRLDAIGLIDDDEFARSEAAAQLRNASRSSGAVTRRLRQRGVSAQVAEAAVQAAAESEGVDDTARCETAAWKRARQLRAFDRTTAHRRLSGFLMRRGFSSALVFATCRRVFAEWGAIEDGSDGHTRWSGETPGDDEREADHASVDD
jgi:regulatory protein